MNCGLCGHAKTDECGYGSWYYNGEKVFLCHPDYPDESHQDCYHLWTVYGKRPVIEGVVTDSLSRYKPFGWAGGMGHHYFFPDWIDQATGLVGWHCSECETKSKEKNDLSM